MSVRQRRRIRRKIEFVVSWMLVITVFLLLIGLLIFFLKPNTVTEQGDEFETVEICTTQAEKIETEGWVAEPPQITVEMRVLVRTADPIPMDAEDTYISGEIQLLCVEVGEQTGYCPEFLMALVEAESSGEQYAENGPCKGLMQINTDWPEISDYMSEHGYTDVYDCETNIRLGCFVLDQKREIYGDDIYAVLMGYNGSSNVMERMENGDYTDYAVKVVNRTWELERLHDK